MCNILTKEDVEMTVELDVRLEDETVWLTQAQMSQLFSVKEHTITYCYRVLQRDGSFVT